MGTEQKNGVFCKGSRTVLIFKLELRFITNPENLTGLVMKVGDSKGDSGHLSVVFGISYMTKTDIKFMFISLGTQVGPLVQPLLKD